MPYIILSHLPPTDWTPQTSQSVNILLGLCQWHARNTFILHHTCWPWRCLPLQSFILITCICTSYNFLSWPNLSGVLRESPWIHLCCHWAWLWPAGSVAPLLWCPASYLHIHERKSVGTFIMHRRTKNPFGPILSVQQEVHYIDVWWRFWRIHAYFENYLVLELKHHSLHIHSASS